MDGKSLDVVAILKEKLFAITPESFSEGEIDWEKLRAALGEDNYFSNERYVLNWAGKSDAFKIMQVPTTKTLIPVREESINFGETENIFIEGENLETLKTLQKSYFGKIKMIYIDPPYNTGNDSFTYPDKFSETKEEYQERVDDKDEDGYMTKYGMFHKNSKENGQYHSNWLNMMYPRLFMAKTLLKEGGIIFVSIDDHEVHNLRLAMNEIFGEENFVANIAWRKSDNQANIGDIARVKEYILLFSKGSEFLSLNKMTLTDKAKKEYRYSDKNGAFRRAILLDKTRGRHYFDVETPTGKILKGPWMKNKKEFLEMDRKGRIHWTKGGQEQPYGKIYMEESKGQIANDFLGIEFGSNQQASLEVEALLEGRYFDFPKSTTLIKHFITIGSTSNDIILDFFAGSGTLAHAVLDLNKEDGGNRKFICIQLPEPCKPKSEAYKAGYKTIADISKERIRRVIKKIKEEQKEQLDLRESKQDLGFKVFKLCESNFKQWQPKLKSVEELTEQMRLFINPINGNPTEDSISFELLLKSGLDLNSKIEKKAGFYLVNENELALVLSKTTLAIFETIITYNPQGVIALDTAFNNNDQLKTNAALQLKDAGIDFRMI